MEAIKEAVHTMDTPEIEIGALQVQKEASINTDPWTKVEYKSLPTKLKRKVKRLEKKVEDDEEPGKSKLNSTEGYSAYDILETVPPPYDLDQLALLYETNGAHNAAVTIKATNIAGLGYEWVESPRTKVNMEQAQKKGKESFEKLMDKLKLEKLDLDDKLEALNLDDTFNETMMKVWTDVESMGVGYLEIGRNNKGEINYLGHAPAQTLRVRKSGDGFIQIVGNKYVYFRPYGNTLSASPFPNPLDNDPRPNEMMIFKKYSPRTTYYGVPDIVAALSAALGDKFARDYNLDYFENKAVPRYAFILKGAKLSGKSEQTLLNYFRNEIKGKNHTTLYIPLPAGFNQQVDAKFEKIEAGIQESSFIDYIRENRAEILMVHRVPPGKVGIANNANLAISRDADKTFKEQVCRPEQRRIEKKVNRIFAEFTDNFKLKFIEADVVDADIKSRVHDRYLRAKVMRRGEVRSELGLPADPDANEFFEAKEGPGQKTAEGAKPKVLSPADQVGQRKERGQEQDEGRGRSGA